MWWQGAAAVIAQLRSELLTAAVEKTPQMCDGGSWRKRADAPWFDLQRQERSNKGEKNSTNHLSTTLALLNAHPSSSHGVAGSKVTTLMVYRRASHGLKPEDVIKEIQSCNPQCRWNGPAMLCSMFLWSLPALANGETDEKSSLEMLSKLLRVSLMGLRWCLCSWGISTCQRLYFATDRMMMHSSCRLITE